MTKTERALREVSDLYHFYLMIQRMKGRGAPPDLLRGWRRRKKQIEKEAAANVVREPQSRYGAKPRARSGRAQPKVTGGKK